MRLTTAFAVLSCVAVTSLAGTAHAEEPGTADPMRAAGWAVIGLSTSLGGGSVATGAVLLSEGRYSDRIVASATLIGGIVTVAVGLVVGVPLALHASPDRPRDRTALERALSGEIRF